MHATSSPHPTSHPTAYAVSALVMLRSKRSCFDRDGDVDVGDYAFDVDKALAEKISAVVKGSVAWLLSHRSSSGWRSTIDTVWAANAMSDVFAHTAGSAMMILCFIKLFP